MMDGASNFAIESSNYPFTRKSEEEFAMYKEKEYAKLRDRDAYKRPIDNPRKITVVGYGETAKELLKVCMEEEGKGSIELQWGPNDKMLHIMQRLEAIIRIPLASWRLTGEGKLLDPTMILASRYPLLHKKNELGRTSFSSEHIVD